MGSYPQEKQDRDLCPFQFWRFHMFDCEYLLNEMLRHQGPEIVDQFSEGLRGLIVPGPGIPSSGSFGRGAHSGFQPGFEFKSGKAKQVRQRFPELWRHAGQSARESFLFRQWNRIAGRMMSLHSTLIRIDEEGHADMAQALEEGLRAFGKTSWVRRTMETSPKPSRELYDAWWLAAASDQLPVVPAGSHTDKGVPQAAKVDQPGPVA